MKSTFSVKEAAMCCGVSPATIYDMVRANEIPHVRVRRRILFHKDVLNAWLKGTQSKV
ncbi:MAG: hypothetical protein RLZ12_892 [Bacillota bacterium]|jgi:excisionase family DNA binding protein